MDTCYIIGASPFDEVFAPDASDFVIAADGGQQALRQRGIRPHLVVGDFDSSDEPCDLPTVRHPVEKDETDTELAVREGILRGYTTFVFYGCTGGRPDHTFANIQTLYHLSREGMHGFLVGDGMVGTVVVDRTLTFAPRGHVSVFSLSDESFGVTIEGLKYTLQDTRLTNDVPLGVSNEGNGNPAKIKVARGALYVLWEDQR